VDFYDFQNTLSILLFYVGCVRLQRECLGSEDSLDYPSTLQLKQTNRGQWCCICGIKLFHTGFVLYQIRLIRHGCSTWKIWDFIREINLNFLTDIMNSLCCIRQYWYYFKQLHTKVIDLHLLQKQDLLCLSDSEVNRGWCKCMTLCHSILYLSISLSDLFYENQRQQM